MSGTPGRLLSLLSLLQARRDWPGALLAERLSVSARTVRRDVERLRELGYPVEAVLGPDGGYRLRAGADLPPMLFDDEQAVALAVGLHLATASGVGVADAAWRALAVLRQVMPARLRQRVDSVQVTPLPGARTGREAPEVDPAVLVAVTDAVRARQVLRLDLARPPGADGGPAAPRRVEPHHVLARAGRWYLLAWDLDRDDWRTFRLDRIAPRTPLGARFTPRAVPGGDPGAFVAARFRGSDRPDGDWPCRGRVVLAAPAAAVAPYAGEAATSALGPDRCLVSLGAWSWEGVAASAVRFGADVEAVSPPQLARGLADLADRCARAAAAPPAPGPS